jgi:hypothetical protein
MYCQFGILLKANKGGLLVDTLFLVALIVEAIFGIGFVLVPAAMLGPFGVTFTDIGATFARLFGSALITFPILLWFARRSDKPEFKKGVVYSLLPYYLVSTILLVIAQLAGLVNALGWIVICIHVVLLVWFGYFAVKK